MADFKKALEESRKEHKKLIELIKFTVAEISPIDIITDECAESILKDFNNSKY